MILSMIFLNLYQDVLKDLRKVYGCSVFIAEIVEKEVFIKILKFFSILWMDLYLIKVEFLYYIT